MSNHTSHFDEIRGRMDAIREAFTLTRNDDIRESLKLVAVDLANAKRAHKDCIRLAREQGLTLQEIGSLVGLSEGRIRQMLRDGK